MYGIVSIEYPVAIIIILLCMCHVIVMCSTCMIDEHTPMHLPLQNRHFQVPFSKHCIHGGPVVHSRYKWIIVLNIIGHDL